MKSHLSTEKERTMSLQMLSPDLDIYEKVIELTCSKDNHHTTGRDSWPDLACWFITTTAIPQHELHYSTYITKKKKFCKNKVCKLHSGIDSSFYLNNDSILKWSVIINNLEVCMAVVLFALTNTLIHKFHNCRGHQGCARTLNALKKRFWWKGMQKDV